MQYNVQHIKLYLTLYQLQKKYVNGPDPGKVSNMQKIPQRATNETMQEGRAEMLC